VDWVTYTRPRLRRTTRLILTRSFRFKFQKKYAGKAERYKSVAVLNAGKQTSVLVVMIRFSSFPGRTYSIGNMNT
jgi:hypothetical protein